MTTKRIIYSIFWVHILLSFCWWALHICLPADLRMEPLFDTLLYYGMLCTLPIWLYPIGKVIRKSFNYNEILGVLVIILMSVIVLVCGVVGLFVFSIDGPKAVWYKDKTHIITDGYASQVCSFFVCDRGVIVDKVKSQGFTGDSPIIPDSAQWKFYDQWGALIAWSDNKLDEGRGMKAYNLFITDSLLYKRHQKEVLNLRKSYLMKERNYVLNGHLSCYGRSLPNYEFEYNTRTRMMSVDGGGFDSKTDVSFKLSQEANDSIVAFIHQHPEEYIDHDEDVEHYGQGDVCVWLDVNRRTVFDCDNSDFAHMPVPFQNIIRLFANKHVRGRDLLQVVDNIHH